MFHYEVHTAGNLFWQEYRFPERGDGIPMHEHTTRDDQHTVTVLRGSVVIFGPRMSWEVVVRQGQTYDIPNDRQQHEVIALEDDTLTMHHNKYGPPPGPLDADDLRGTGLRKTTIKLP